MPGGYRRRPASYTPRHRSQFRDSAIELSPALFLTTWACGLAGVTAVVAAWKVVGPGFGWLAGAVTALFGGIGFAVGGGWAAGTGTAAAVIGLALAGRPHLSAPVFASGAVLFAVSSVPDGGIAATLTGAMLLGGVTGEMLLGHWFLIDPTLPRWALKRLAALGAVGVVADAGVVGLEAGADWVGEVVGWAFVVLVLTTLVLMVAVWFALNEPSYPGVMAATGLSYLAILTAIGAAVAGRAVIDEGTGLLSGGVLLGTLPLL